VTTLQRERPAPPRPANGGLPARRAVVRWAWRLFRREWRQQLLVLALLTVALAATTVGLGFITNVTARQQAQFGDANQIITIAGTDPNLAADIALARSRFGTIDVIEHEKVPIPGSVSSIDVRSLDPAGPYVRAMIRLDSGRYPSGPADIAVTRRFADIFDLHGSRARPGTSWGWWRTRPTSLKRSRSRRPANCRRPRPSTSC
jgi:putative ABC transport system permease protein